jgi:UDPglucose 6-dehydrogenase
MDPRIGPAFLKAGIGYGGACLPKDVRGLGTFAEGIGAVNAARLLDVVDAVNAGRADQVISLVQNVAGPVAGKRIGVWGAAFKAGTDDVRDSAGLKIADGLRLLGAEVTVYDPMASGNALVAVPELRYADSAQIAPADVASDVARAVVIDACQGIDILAWHAAGWEVSSLVTGRPGSQVTDDSLQTSS